MAPGRSARQTSLYRAVWRASRSVWVDPYTARVTGSKGRNDIVQISSPLLALGRTLSVAILVLEYFVLRRIPPVSRAFGFVEDPRVPAGVGVRGGTDTDGGI